MKIFAWRLIRDNLPKRSMTCRHKDNIDDIFQFNNNEKENISPMNKSCLFFKDIWGKILPNSPT